jgi:hypothetical protein
LKKLLVCAAALSAAVVPAHAASAGPPAGARLCPKGYVGVIVYRGDYNTGGPIDVLTVCAPVEE